jgi:hypothetical protein
MTPWILNTMMAFQLALVIGLSWSKSWGWAIFFFGCLIANVGVKVVQIFGR